MKSKQFIVVLLLAFIGYAAYPQIKSLIPNKNEEAKKSATKTAPEIAPTLRPIPAPQQDLTPKPNLPKPLFSGGTSSPISNALNTNNQPQKLDEQLRPWTPITTASFKHGRSLKNTSFFFVLKPIDNPQSYLGIFGNGARNYSNFLSLKRVDANRLFITGEDATNRGTGRTTPATFDTPALGAPFLIEIHPIENELSQILINGKPAATVSSNIQANVFGAGYSGNHFKGEIGHISAYPALSTAHQATIRKNLIAWWSLPSETQQKFPESHRAHPAVVNHSTNTNTSGALTLQLNSKEPATSALISASVKTNYITTNLPKNYTSINGQSWLIQSSKKSSAAILSFDQPQTLNQTFVGENGFYGLLYRENKDQPWQEWATASACKNQKINFSVDSLKSGIITIGIVQGIPAKKSSATLAINGTPIEKTATITPGEHFTLTSANHSKNQKITVTDTQSGLIWYRGNASELKLSSFALRSDIQLRAHYENSAAFLGSRTDISLKLDTTKPPLYPGILAKVIRSQKSTPNTLLSPAEFSPQAPKLPLKGTYADYPAYRTAESIIAPPFDDVTKQWFTRPYYFHSIIASPNLYNDRKQIIAHKSAPKFPLGDLTPGSHAHLSGKLLIAEPGDYQFKLTTNATAQLSINTKKANSNELTLKLNSGSADLSIIYHLEKDSQPFQSQLLWKTPSASAFTPIPEAHLSHPVPLNHLKAYKTLTKDFSYRNTTIGSSPEQEALTALKKFDPQPHATHHAAFNKAISPLIASFKKSGNPAFANAAFTLIHARIQHIRENPAQMKVHQFAKTDGQFMALNHSLRPFFGVCERFPELQIPALNALAQLNAYATATCLSRSSMSEGHDGTNDGYGDRDNLLRNFWIAAACIDSPYAYDAATCLMDSHFHYTPGRSGGLSSDGIWAFHNANGRQIHMGGYGSDWFRRVAFATPRLRTPWGFTTEQCRRLTEYLLAYEWFFYKDTVSFLANGRGNSHRGNASGLISFINPALGLTPLSESSRTNLEQLKKRLSDNPKNSITGHRFFFRNLYTIHRKKDFFIESKMISPMSGPIETFAGHFHWNMNFGDGTHFFLKTGREYDPIHINNYNAAQANQRDGKPSKMTRDGRYSLWQYRALPGTTMSDHEIADPDRYRSGTGKTAGGVSDGELGHAAFHYTNRRVSTTVTKFYSYTQDGIAVLNTQINPTRKLTEGTTIRSNINQCGWTGDVTIHAQNGTSKTIKFQEGEQNQNIRLKLDRRYLITHAGIAYLILPTKNEMGTEVGSGYLDLKLQTRTPLTPVPGAPKELTKVLQAIKDKQAKIHSAKVFYLSIDHGQSPANASCSYVVSMRAETIPPQAWLTKPPIEILSNTHAVQSLTDTRDGAFHAFFREAGTLKNAQGQPLITTPTPASIMWRSDKKTITVQDPIAACTSDTSQMLDTLKATLHPALTNKKSTQEIAIPLTGINDPDDRYRGKPASTHLP